VYVWEAISSSTFLSVLKGNPGHVSMRTYVGGPEGKGVYVSYWPAGFKKSLAEDIVVEQTEPVEFNFFTLDVKTINERFEMFMGDLNWSLLGALKFGTEGEVAIGNQCCSGLVYDLLCSAGLTRLLPRLTTLFDNKQISDNINHSAAYTRSLLRTATRIRNPVLQIPACALALLAVSATGLVSLGNEAKNYLSKKDVIISPQDISTFAQEAALKEAEYFATRFDSDTKKLNVQQAYHAFKASSLTGTPGNGRDSSVIPSSASEHPSAVPVTHATAGLFSLSRPASLIETLLLDTQKQITEPDHVQLIFKTETEAEDCQRQLQSAVQSHSAAAAAASMPTDFAIEKITLIDENEADASVATAVQESYAITLTKSDYNQILGSPSAYDELETAFRLMQEYHP